MEEEKRKKDFYTKFKQLSPDNQRYIIAIQQALMFAQISTEKAKKEKQYEKISSTIN